MLCKYCGKLKQDHDKCLFCGVSDAGNVVTEKDIEEYQKNLIVREKEQKENEEKRFKSVIVEKTPEQKKLDKISYILFGIGGALLLALLIIVIAYKNAWNNLDFFNYYELDAKRNNLQVYSCLLGIGIGIYLLIISIYFGIKKSKRWICSLLLIVLTIGLTIGGLMSSNILYHVEAEYELTNTENKFEFTYVLTASDIKNVKINITTDSSTISSELLDLSKYKLIFDTYTYDSTYSWNNGYRRVEPEKPTGDYIYFKTYETGSFTNIKYYVQQSFEICHDGVVYSSYGQVQS